jgi:putative hydrolases of HD superfamily
MYRMSLITMLAPPSLASRINVPHCTKMALLHDVAEALVGDITPADGIPKVEKSRRETTTMEYFTKGLLGKVYNGINGKDLMAVWQEYEDGKTLESKFVHDVDKLELILQMLEYEKTHEYEKRPGKLDLGEFSGVIKQVQLPEVRDWCVEILKEREEHWKNIGKEHTT